MGAAWADHMLVRVPVVPGGWAMHMSLDTERSFFESHRIEWLTAHEGEFVLIKEHDFSFYETDVEAYEAGVEKYGGDCDMFITRVLPEDIVEDSLSLLYGLVNVKA